MFPWGWREAHLLAINSVVRVLGLNERSHSLLRFSVRNGDRRLLDGPVLLMLALHLDGLSPVREDHLARRIGEGVRERHEFHGHGGVGRQGRHILQPPARTGVAPVATRR